MPRRLGTLALCSFILCAPTPHAVAESLDADALARRLGVTLRAGPGTTIEDEWGRAEITCTPIAERDVFHGEDTTRGVFLDQDTEVIRRPRVDLEVNFAFGSAELTADAVELLATLAEALEKDRLDDQRFLVVGHTDAVGDQRANQALSEARADAVRRHLVEVHRISPERLKARGCGERMLRDPGDPESPRNRRVEVINAGP